MSLIQSIEKSLLTIMQDKIREFGSLNNLNEEQINATLERMDLGKSLTMPLVVRKSASGLLTGVKEGKVEKVKKNKNKMISLPFNKTCVKEELCGALEYNQGLFTQCQKNHLVDGIYCSSCHEETMSSDNGMPSCGTVEERLSKGLMEFRDAKGRAPTSYLNYLKKKNSSVEYARCLAEEKGETIDEEHFEERRGRPKKASDESSVAKSEKRGRPKKAPVQVKSAKTFDIFTSSVEEVFQSTSSSSVVEEGEHSTSSSSVGDEDEHSTSSSSDEDNVSVTISENQVIEPKKVKRTKEEKEAKAAEKAAKYQEKLVLEQEKEAKKLALEQEKEAKKQALEQEKAAKKQALEQEKAAKKQAAEQETAAKKGEKKTNKSSAKEETKVVEPSTSEAAEEERPKVQVEEFKFEGVTYWKSSENLLYNPTTQECVGTWCVSKNTILPPPEESDDELEEEEYDDEDDERND